MATANLQRVPLVRKSLLLHPAANADSECWSLDTCLNRARDVGIWNVTPANRPTRQKRFELEARVARAFHAGQLGAAQLALARERRETARALGAAYARRRGTGTTPAQEALLERAHRRAEDKLHEAVRQLSRSHEQLGALLNVDTASRMRLTELVQPPQADTLSALLARVTAPPADPGLREHYMRVHRLTELATHYQNKVVDHYRQANEQALRADSTTLQLLRSHEKYYDAREVRLTLLAQSWIEVAELRLALACGAAGDVAAGAQHIGDRRNLT